MNSKLLVARYHPRGAVKLARWRAWWRRFHKPANRYTRTFHV